MKYLTSILFILLTLCGFSEAAIYYVASNGNDTSNGSVSTPWKTIQNGVTNMAAGDTLNIGPGTFSTNSVITCPAKTGASATKQVIISGSGFSTIVTSGWQLGNASYYVIRQISIQIQGEPVPNTSIEFDGSNCMFQNCEITKLSVANVNDNYTCFGFGGTNNIVDGCTIHDFTDIDFSHFNGTNSQISNSLFYNLNNPGYPGEHMDCAQVWDTSGSSNTRIFNNVFHDVNCQLGNFQGRTNKNIYWFNNIYYNCAGNLFAGCPNQFFFNNLYYNTGTNSNLCILDMYDSTTDGTGAWDYTGSRFCNNIFLCPTGSFNPINFQGDGTSNSTLGSCTNNYFAHQADFSALGTVATMGSAPIINGGNPFFSSVAAYDFHLTSSSTILIQQGLNLTSVYSALGITALDKDGVARPATGAWDIGPLQYTTAAAPTPTPSPTPVPTPVPTPTPTPAPTPVGAVTLFNMATPGTVDETDDSAAVTVGVKFTASVSGNVSSILFYKGPSNGGTHIGTLWSVTGTKLGSATFTNETDSGWQTVSIPTVALTAGTTYIVSYHATAGQYAADSNFFASAWVRGNLTAPSDSASGGNGVYVYSSTDAFPSSSFGATNYYADVLFQPAGATPTPTPTPTPRPPSNVRVKPN